MDLNTGLANTARHRGSRAAILVGDRAISWHELVARCARLAAALRAQGVAVGDTVAVLSQNSQAMFEAFHAVPWAGGIVCPLNYRLAPAELAEIIDLAHVSVLLLDAAFSELARSAIARAHSDVEIIEIRGVGADRCSSVYESVLAAHEPMPLRPAGEDVAACLYFTGGTTGRPKGVILTHGNVFANTQNFAMATLTSHTDVLLHANPMFHVAGGSRVYYGSILGATNVIMERFTAESALATIERHLVTSIAAVPTMISDLIIANGRGNFDHSSLKMISYGGAPATPTLIESAIRSFPTARFCQFYGQSEAAPLATFLPPEWHDPTKGKLHSAGWPVTSVELRIVDGDGVEVPQGANGEIALRGPNVMRGYLDNQAETDRALRHGWLYTGDLGHVDADGFLVVVDRLKDMIISGGENVYSIEVENALATHPLVAECAVFGLPDDRWGERVHAVVVPLPDATLTADDVVTHCRERLGGFKVPRSITIRGEPLPRSAANKILKRALRSEFEPVAHIRVPHPVRTQGDLCDQAV